MSNIVGTVEAVTERGEWRTILLRREAADQYERDHAERTLIPFDVSPYVRKSIAAEALRVGACVALTYRLTGREYNGKNYLSAAVDACEVLAGTVDQAASDPDAQPTAGDSAIPF